MSESKTPVSPSGRAPETSKSLKDRLFGSDEDRIDISKLPEMSVEDVDSFLNDEEPDFFNEVSSIAADKSLSIVQINIDDAVAALHAEIDLWKTYKGPLRILFLVFPFMPRITLRLKLWSFKISGWIHGYLVRAKNFSYYLLTDGRTAAISKIKSVIVQALTQISTTIHTFKKISFKVRLILIFSLVLFLLSVAVIYQSVTKGLLPGERENFLSNMSSHATQAYEYETSQVEPYMDNARATQNLFLTQKIFVNLKTSPGSGPNPMGAFEFFIEGMSSDVVIEIKDREPMMRDLMQSVIQDMTYDDLDTSEGKKDLCSRLQKEVSRVLTTGSVKNVRIRSFVIKP